MHELDLEPEVEWDEHVASWTHRVTHPVVGEIEMYFELSGMNTLMTRSTRGDEVLTFIGGATPMGDLGLQFFMVRRYPAR